MPMLEIMARCVSIADFEEERNGMNEVLTSDSRSPQSQ